MAQPNPHTTPAMQKRAGKKSVAPHKAGGDEDKPNPEDPPEYEDTPPPKEKSKKAADVQSPDSPMLDVDKGDIQKARHNLGRNGQKAALLLEEDVEEWQNGGRPARGQSDEHFEEEITHGYHDPDREQHDWHRSDAADIPKTKKS